MRSSTSDLFIHSPANQTQPVNPPLLSCLTANGLSARRAFNELYQQQVDLINRVCQKFPLSEEEAQEAYHESLMDLVRTLSNPDFVLSCKLRTLLSRILSRRCIDLLRKRGAHGHVDETALEGYTGSTADPLHQLIGREQLDVCEHKLGQLGSRLYEVLRASAEGYNSAEIAQQYGYKNAATVDVLKHRARQILRSTG